MPIIGEITNTLLSSKTLIRGYWESSCSTSWKVSDREFDREMRTNKNKKSNF